MSSQIIINYFLIVYESHRNQTLEENSRRKKKEATWRTDGVVQQ
ncbi:hypothetical protein OAK30_02590 [Candidatus Nitrosopelagicus sp.]|nr:hypothetical protein [Candidatus Nitrosopelagicus sp.]